MKIPWEVQIYGDTKEESRDNVKHVNNDTQEHQYNENLSLLYSFKSLI